MFLEFNLATLPLRRDIGLLGLLYKCGHRKHTSHFSELLPLVDLNRPGMNTRLSDRRHDLQLQSYSSVGRSE